MHSPSLVDIYHQRKVWWEAVRRWEAWGSGPLPLPLNPTPAYRHSSTESGELTSAGLGVRHGLAEVAVVSTGAVVAVSAGRVVATLDADAAAATTRQQVEFLVEATATSVQVATTRCTSMQAHPHSHTADYNYPRVTIISGDRWGGVTIPCAVEFYHFSLTSSGRR